MKNIAFLFLLDIFMEEIPKFKEEWL